MLPVKTRQKTPRVLKRITVISTVIFLFICAFFSVYYNHGCCYNSRTNPGIIGTGTYLPSLNVTASSGKNNLTRSGTELQRNIDDTLNLNNASILWQNTNKTGIQPNVNYTNVTSLQKKIHVSSKANAIILAKSRENVSKPLRAANPADREYHSKDYLRSLELFAAKALMTTSVPVTLPLDYPIQCDRLMKGDKYEISRTEKKLEMENFSPPQDLEFTTVHEDCDNFISSNGYYTKPRSQEEDEFPLAFTIRMHADVAMAEMLLRNIYHPQNIYCIHIDKKSPPAVHQAMESITKCLPGVFLTKRNVNYVYGSFSAVEADMACMQDLLTTGVKWKYLLNMAGSEFPLKTNLELVRVLKLLNGTNDIEQYFWASRFNIRINSSATIDPVVNYVLPSNIPKVPFRLNITLMKGCSYNTFSRAFVEWALSDPLARDFINWTRDTIAPDETVWSTLNYLPDAPGGYQVEISETAKTFLSREIIWQWSSAYCWNQKFVRGICILSSRDLSWLSQRWEFLANKFDLSYDHIVVECLQESLRNRTKNPDPDENTHLEIIKKFPHVQVAIQRSR